MKSAPLQNFAPAKLNLTLHVTGQRADGYHLLDSLVVFANVGDTLTLTRADGNSLEITGQFAEGLEQHSDNLVLNAAGQLNPLRASNVLVPLSRLAIDDSGRFLTGVQDVFDVLTLEGSLAARNITGGTAPEQVRRQVAAGRKLIAD